MKVCVMTTSYPPKRSHYAGGFVHELAARVAGRGHEVCVVAPHIAGAKCVENIDNVRVHRFRYMWPYELETLAYHGGIPSNLRRQPVRTLVQALPFAGSFLAAGLSAAKGCDLIHAHFAQTAAVAVLVGRARGVPVVLTVHGSDVNDFLGGPIGRLSRTITGHLLRSVQRVVAPSRALADILCSQRLPDDAVVVIPNGVDLEAFPFRPKGRNGRVLLWVGRLAPEKGVEYLIRAMSDVRARFTDVQLLLVGDGPLSDDLKALAGSLGLGDSVLFVGRQPRSEVPRRFAEADVFVLPSLADAFGVTLIEAMASGCAVVASRVGGLPEVLANGECGVLVPPGDPLKLAQAINELLADGEKRASLAVKGRARVDAMYGIDSVVERLLGVYAEVRDAYRSTNRSSRRRIARRSVTQRERSRRQEGSGLPEAEERWPGR